MGKNSKKQAGDFDSEDKDRANSEKHEDRTPGTQTDQDFDPYLEAFEELETHMAASKKSMQIVEKFYKQQKFDIQNAVANRKKLDKTVKKCQLYEITIDTLQDHEKEKDKKLAKKVADIGEKETALDKAKGEAENHRMALEKQKESLNKRMSTMEAEQKAKLDEQRMKLEKEQDQKYEKRVETLEKQTKARQEDDNKKIAELKVKNDELSQKLEDQKSKLKQAEARCKDAEKLKIVYEAEAEKLNEKLKIAENEFGLNAGTTEFYKEKFCNIHRKIQDISQYVKELDVGDLNALHNKIEKADEGFEFVPISSSETSEKLRIAHAQRVISAQLWHIIWQPFSSETTFQDPKYVSLFSQISNGLVESYGKRGGFRAARLCTALIIRGLQSQPSTGQSSPTSKSSIRRAETFTEKVMLVLSLLVKPSLHSNLRNNLLNIAKSAISIWDFAQTDQREVIVYPTLAPESLGGYPDDRVIVLFPRVTARSYPRIADTPSTSIPGAFEEPETELYTQETCIYEGAGLMESSSLVSQGEAEEEERKEKEEKTKLEEERRMLEEREKKLANSGMGQKQRSSQSRKSSVAGSGSRPIATWMNGGGQKISEGRD